MSSAGRTSRIPTYVSVTSTVVILVLACLLGLASSAVAAPRLGGGGPLPLAFEPNQGQADPSVKFLARGRGYGLFLTPSETVLVLAPATRTGPRAQRRDRCRRGCRAEPAVVRMRFVGADPDAHIEGVTPLPGRSHYFVGEQGQTLTEGNHVLILSTTTWGELDRTLTVGISNPQPSGLAGSPASARGRRPSSRSGTTSHAWSSSHR